MDLTPRVYRNGSKNTAQPKNVVDTLNFEVIDNALPEESQVIASKEITSGHIYGTSAAVTLPVDSSQPSRHFHFTTASRHTAGADYTFAKGRAEVLLMYDTTTFTLDRPVDEIPVVSFELTGTSKVKPRGTGSFINYPTFENMLDPNYNLVNWFNTASGVQNQDTLQQDYVGARVAVNAWVKNFKTSGYLQADDINTSWYDFGHPSRIQATETDWSDSAYQVADIVAGTITPKATLQMRNGSFTSTIVTGSFSVPIQYTLSKLSPIKYSVSWVMPVRYVYCAASRSYTLIPNSTYDIDNYAFMDLVSKITLKLTGRLRSAETTTLSYSLSNRPGVVVDSPGKNTAPFKISGSEALTLQTYWSSPSQLWTKELAGKLLRKYERGKYTFTCDVSIGWALQNNVHIGTQMYVKTIGGDYVQRARPTGGKYNVLFEVLTIEKRFDGRDFIYVLGMREV